MYLKDLCPTLHIRQTHRDAAIETSCEETYRPRGWWRESHTGSLSTDSGHLGATVLVKHSWQSPSASANVNHWVGQFWARNNMYCRFTIFHFRLHFAMFHSHKRCFIILATFAHAMTQVIVQPYRSLKPYIYIYIYTVYWDVPNSRTSKDDP